MEKVNNNSEIELLKDNKIVGEPDLQNSFIRFEGENNVLFCENDVVIGNSKIVFNGDNGVVYLSSNKHKYFLNITIYRDALIYIGKNNYFNGQFNIISSERKNVIIGEGSVFSFGIWARTADPHIIYDAKTHKRINQSKSIVIGDHTWIGQNAIILKNTFVGSGSVLAAMSVAAGKTLQSNAIYAGNPIRKKEKIYFSVEKVHIITQKNKPNLH